jgi:hypothetical protein
MVDEHAPRSRRRSLRPSEQVAGEEDGERRYCGLADRPGQGRPGSAKPRVNCHANGRTITVTLACSAMTRDGRRSARAAQMARMTTARKNEQHELPGSI